MAIAGLVKPGWRCLNVGANVGYYSILLGDLSGPSGCVACVEPCNRSREILRKNLRINGMAESVIVSAMAGERSEDVTLYYLHNNLGCATGHPESLSGYDGVTESQSSMIVRLDEVSGLGGIPYDFILIDTEGMDFAALRGCAGLMKPTTVVAIEFCESLFGRGYGEGGRQMIESVLGSGLWPAPPKLYYIEYDGSFMPVSPAVVATQPNRLWNLVFAPETPK